MPAAIAPARDARVQEALYRIASAASAASDLDAFYAEIHAIVGQLMYAENFYIALYDPERDALRYPYNLDTVDPEVIDPEVWHQLGATRLGRGTTAYVLRTGRPIRFDIETLHELERAGELEAAGTVEETGDWIGAPLTADGRTLGVIVVQSYTDEHRYDDADLGLLAFVGQHIGSALSRATAIEETRERNAELTVINEIGTALAKQLDFDEICEVVGERVRAIFQAPSVAIGLLDESSRTISWPYELDDGQRIHSGPFELGSGLTSIVISTRQPLRAGTSAELDHLGAVLIGVTVSESWLGVPILSGERVIGLIDLESTEQNVFSASDERLLVTIAASMGVALENARLFGETKRLLAETDERAAELALINDVQRGLAERLDMQAMYDLVGDRIQSIFDAQVVDIAVVDRSDGLIHFPYTMENGERFPDDPVPNTNNHRTLVMETRKPLMLNHDIRGWAASMGFPFYVQPGTGAPQSAIYVPLVAGDESTGRDLAPEPRPRGRVH